MEFYEYLKEVSPGAGRTVAAATPRRFFLADELLERPAGDPETVFVCYMCAYAREVLTGELPGPFCERDARRFAQAALIPRRAARARARQHPPRRCHPWGSPEHELADALANAKGLTRHIAREARLIPTPLPALRVRTGFRRCAR